MLHSAEGSVRGGGAGPDSLAAGALPGESQQPPEGKGEEHEAPAAPEPTRRHQRATNPQPQTALRAQDLPDPPGSRDHSGPEEPPAEEGPLQEATKIDFLLVCETQCKPASTLCNFPRFQTKLSMQKEKPAINPVSPYQKKDFGVQQIRF